MFDVTTIIEAVITIIVVLVSAFLIPLIKSKVDATTLNKILDYVKILVMAAEQIFDRADGAAKKQYVIDNLCAKFGVKVDTPTIDAAIEAAVLELHNQMYYYPEDAGDNTVIED